MRACAKGGSESLKVFSSTFSESTSGGGADAVRAHPRGDRYGGAF